MNDELHRGLVGGPSGWMPIIVGLVLNLIGIGLPMIGVTVNLWLGLFILAIAFALIAWGLWIFAGTSPRRKMLQIVAIIATAVVYFFLVGRQIRAEYMKDHPIISKTPHQDSTPQVVINQDSGGSNCSNLVAGSDSKINCESEKEPNDKNKANH